VFKINGKTGDVARMGGEEKCKQSLCGEIGVKK
jgi:hypothetical protein